MSIRRGGALPMALPPGGTHSRGWRRWDDDDESRCQSTAQRVVDTAFPWVVAVAAALFVFVVVVLALPSNSTAHLAVVPKLLTADECDTIVAAAEAVAAKRGGWETERHRHYPTTDFALSSVPVAEALWNSSIERRVMQALADTVARDLRLPLVPDDVFIVKYSATQPQRGLRLHRDHSHVSFNVALNRVSDYEGGGTHVALLGPAEATTIRIGRGDVLMHSSGLVHEGMNVTRGSRYILVGFVMGSFSQLDLWLNTWGFTSNCVDVNTPAEGAGTICVSRLTAAYHVLSHCYAILADNTPTVRGVPLLVVAFVACVVALVGGCVWEGLHAGDDDGDDFCAPYPDRRAATKAD